MPGRAFPLALKPSEDRMSLVVQKYGGRCLETPEQIKAVAQRVVATKRACGDIIVVVSAMGATTDQLTDLAAQITSSPAKRELDMLLTAGERISMALLAIAINDIGHHAISFTGSQSGIITDHGHGEARIVDVKAFRIRDEMERGKIVIVAGFQGVSGAKEVTTLGRGGSDLTAVTLAAAFGAERCELYKDVGGVFTADPWIVPNAKRIPRLSYKQLIELIGAGSQVVQDKAVLAARRFGIPLSIRSGFEETEGTIVTDKPTADFPLRGIGVRKQVMVISVEPADNPRQVADVLSSLASANIPVYMMTSSMGGSAEGAVNVVVDTVRADRAVKAIEASGGVKATLKKKIGLLSLVGDSAGSPEIAGKALADLAEGGVPVDGICATPTNLTCVTSPDKAEDGVRALHKRIEAQGGK